MGFKCKKSEKVIVRDFYSIYWRSPTVSELLQIKGGFQTVDNYCEFLFHKYGGYRKFLKSIGYPAPTRNHATYILISADRYKNILMVGTAKDIYSSMFTSHHAFFHAYNAKGLYCGKYIIEKLEFEDIYDENGELREELKVI